MIITFVIYGSIYIFLVFCAICIACGLYFMAEIAEQNARLIRDGTKLSIVAIAVVHVLLLFDGISFICIFIGICTHFSYWKLMTNFPFMVLDSKEVILSCVATVINNISWIWFFWKNLNLPMFQILGFFQICVWAVPFCFFIAMEPSTNMLPSQVMKEEPYSDSSSSEYKKKEGTSTFDFFNQGRGNIVKKIARYIQFKKDEFLPTSFAKRNV